MKNLVKPFEPWNLLEVVLISVTYVSSSFHFLYSTYKKLVLFFFFHWTIKWDHIYFETNGSILEEDSFNWVSIFKILIILIFWKFKANLWTTTEFVWEFYSERNFSDIVKRLFVIIYYLVCHSRWITDIKSLYFEQGWASIRAYEQWA